MIIRCHVCADHPGPRVGAQFQKSPDVEQPPRGSLRPAAVLRTPGRFPLLLRHTGSAENTQAGSQIRIGDPPSLHLLSRSSGTGSRFELLPVPGPLREPDSDLGRVYWDAGGSIRKV